MKHFLEYLCFIVALCAAGCSKTTVETEDEKGIPMTFDAVDGAEKARALLDTDKVNQNGNKLTVYDLHTTASNEKILYMDDTQVTYTDGNWTYSPIKYWTSTGTHSFMAYLSEYNGIKLGETVNYPKVTYDKDTETLNIANGTSPWEITLRNQFDFLYAYHSRNMKDPDAFSPVSFSLNHLLCAVRFNIVNRLPDIPIKFKQFILSGIYNEASASIVKSGINPNGSTTVTFHGGMNDTDFQTFSFEGINLNYNESHNIFASAVTVGEDGYVLLWPHAGTQFGNIKVTIVYNDGGDKDITKEIELNSSTQIKSWSSGQRYTYNFFIEDNHISFDVKVVPWVEDDVIIEE